MPTGATPSAPATSTTTNPSVTVTWSAVNYVGRAVAVAGYTVKRYKAGVADTVAGTCTGTVTAVSCNDTLTVAGAYQYTITPKSGLWVGVEGSKGGTVTYAPVAADTTGPVITGSCPTSATVTTYTRGNTGTWVTLCAEKISFTATDATGVGTVQISVREGSTGSSWLTAAGNFNGSSETKMTLTPASGVYTLGLPDNKLSNNKTYNITVYANDTATPVNASTTAYSFKTP